MIQADHWLGEHPDGISQVQQGECAAQVRGQPMDTSAQSVPNQTTPSTQTSPNQSKLSASTDQPANYSTALKSERSPKIRRTSRNQSQRDNFSMKNRLCPNECLVIIGEKGLKNIDQDEVRKTIGKHFGPKLIDMISISRKTQVRLGYSYSLTMGMIREMS